MRDDFCVLVLTHGRPENLRTLRTLDHYGYTGKTYLVCDSEDPTLELYQELYGDQVLTFDKADYADRFDEGDNFPGRRGVVYARNASFDIARSVGCRYFIQLDDDYIAWGYRFNQEGVPGWFTCGKKGLDELFEAMVEFLIATPFLSVATSQGGDHIGGPIKWKTIGTKRKAMNTFVCDTERPFTFPGRINEDVNAYCLHQLQGEAFLTFLQVQVNQVATQQQEGGLTEIYLDAGTYVKSFYSLLYTPSCIEVRDMGDRHRRLHHKIDWNACAPKILRESEKKPPES